MEASTSLRTKTNSVVPDIAPGDMVRVSFRVREANRERVQILQGLVVKVRLGGGGGSFTIRKVAYGVGVEHTFPFGSPFLERVEVVRRGKVRRAKLYYIRRLSARESRLKERREKIAEATVSEMSASEGEQIGEPVNSAGIEEKA